MDKLKCKKKGCEGALISLFYKVGTTWKLVKDQKVCPVCGTLYFVDVIIKENTNNKAIIQK